MNIYNLNFLTIFITLSVCTSIAKAAPFAQDSHELDCIIHPQDIKYNMRAYPVEPSFITQEKLNNQVWLRHETGSDYIFTSFGIVNTNQLERNALDMQHPAERIVDIVDWNANGELTNLMGHTLSGSSQIKISGNRTLDKANWWNFRFKYNIHNNTWGISGILRIEGIPVMIDTNNALCVVS